MFLQSELGNVVQMELCFLYSPERIRTWASEGSAPKSAPAQPLLREGGVGFLFLLDLFYLFDAFVCYVMCSLCYSLLFWGVGFLLQGLEALRALQLRPITYALSYRYYFLSVIIKLWYTTVRIWYDMINYGILLKYGILLSIWYDMIYAFNYGILSY